jgi:hypothetical protein
MRMKFSAVWSRSSFRRGDRSRLCEWNRSRLLLLLLLPLLSLLRLRLRGDRERLFGFEAVACELIAQLILRHSILAVHCPGTNGHSFTPSYAEYVASPIETV